MSSRSQPTVMRRDRDFHRGIESVMMRRDELKAIMSAHNVTSPGAAASGGGTGTHPSNYRIAKWMFGLPGRSRDQYRTDKRTGKRTAIDPWGAFWAAYPTYRPGPHPSACRMQEPVAQLPMVSTNNETDVNAITGPATRGEVEEIRAYVARRNRADVLIQEAEDVVDSEG